MDIPNNYPPDSRGWHHIEAIKWWIRWEELISKQDPNGKTPEQFASDMIPDAKEFLRSHDPGELSDVILHLVALRKAIDELLPLLAGFDILHMVHRLGKEKEFDKDNKGKQLTDMINEMFASCGIPRVGEDFDPT